MQKLFQLLLKYLHVLVFLLLEVVSLWLIVSYNDYPKSVFFTSGNAVTGQIYNMVAQTTEYFGLRKENDLLAQENAQLKRTIFMLESALDRKLSATDTLLDSISVEKNYRFVSAKVINNDVNKPQNYITLNKGSRDGVKVDMGVVSAKGVVGIVSAVSDHFSVVISLLNPQIKVSCRLSHNKYVGSLVWDGVSCRTAKLEDISEHVVVAEGDTVITSGFSAIFPEKIPVGVVERVKRGGGNSYYDIDVRLFTEFGSLSHVDIINFQHKEEYSNFEKSVRE